MMWFINYFHIQILLIELLFCYRMQRREHFLVRFLPMTAVYCGLPFLVEGSFFNRHLVWGWFTFGFLIMFVLSGVLVFSCFRMNLRQTVFYCCVAHTLQHMVHCLYRIAEIVLMLNNTAAQALQLVFMALVCVIVWYTLRNRFRESDTVEMRNGPLVAFACVSTLFIYVISYWTTSLEKETVGVLVFDVTTCLLQVFILLDVFRLRSAEKEQMLMQRMLRQEQEQHALSRATIDVINRKCHDLRHQIAALRNMNPQDQEKSIGELEQAVLIYDSFPKSGNENVDLVLAEKYLLAEEEHITIRSVVDGSGFSFMRVEDLYSLLGNALDNAIEATRGEPKETRRIITLSAARRGSMFSVHIENPCAARPLFADGLPVTTKEDTDYHGYGMRSMRYLCEKYGGVMNAAWEAGIFSLDMLFPSAGE
ncbi:MAG: GHKL domain-containing protein [Clostridia bacterium]|jgi:hypothetical protein|nr:GHKL domain-containing protein [Clostridia bacterium]